MNGRLLLRHGTLVDSRGRRTADLLVEDGFISRIGPDITPEDDMEVIDISGKYLTYGLADVHVHFRVPGRPDKETILSGSKSAARGGYTCVCPMPNLSPVPDSPEHLEEELALIRRDAVVDVRPYASITVGREGRQVVDVEALKDKAVAFSDDGSGVQDDEVMTRAMTDIANAGSILAAHCEDNRLLRGGYIHDGKYAREHGHKGICSESEWGQIARDVELSAKTGCPYHICHISTKESLDVIRKAKARGIDVSCETGPHYLTLCEDDLQEDGRFKMNPPLRGAEDRDALLGGLNDGSIDMIATDHAPHTAEEKSRGLQGSAMGIVGLETAFPVLYTKLVRTGVITLERLTWLMSESPRKRFRLGGSLAEGQSADLAVFDTENEYSIDPSGFLSKGRSTPFEGWKVYGKCILTLYKGEKVWEDNN